ncbi:hypothetical protein AAGW05_12425 [Arthrobacter sp. LAPM80]|uniref:hypothetical protein n=1 Tax=Arthrobacter sp. LAPM80 TaxID=3141788 RepID=UPI00398BB3C9
MNRRADPAPVGRAMVAPPIDPGFYPRAVSKKYDGEWEYESEWRPDRGFPLTPSFLNAVFQGQAQVAHGLGRRRAGRYRAGCCRTTALGTAKIKSTTAPHHDAVLTALWAGIARLVA